MCLCVYVCIYACALLHEVCWNMKNVVVLHSTIYISEKLILESVC